MTANRSWETRSARRVSCSTAQAVGDDEGHDGDDDHRGRGHEVDGVRSHPPHGQAAEAVTGSRPSPGDGRTLGGEHEEGEGGRR